MAFGKNHIALELTQSFPTSFSQNDFEPDHAHPAFAYRHFMDQNWFMGVAFGYRIWKRRTTEAGQNKQVAIWSITHETFRLMRLYHPTYLAGGLRLHYLNPTQSATLPLVRDEQLETEMGAALSIMLMHQTGSGTASFRIDRWRGLDTMILHGIEVGLGYHYALD